MLFWTSVSLCTRAAIQLRNDAFYLNGTHTEVLGPCLHGVGDPGLG